MKVGFIVPLGIAAVNGGVRTQALQTAKALQKLGVEVEFVSPWQDRLDVDLVHIFVAGPDTLGILTRCSELGIKTVLSPVFFSSRSSSTIAKALSGERLIAKIGSGIRSDFGIKAQACRIADVVLPNTTAEVELIVNGLGIAQAKVQVVPNGVETRFAEATPNEFIEKYGIKDFVLCVGQVGAPRKNLRKLMEAAPDVKAQIVVIGSLFDDEYGNTCKKLAQKSGNVLFIETLDHEDSLLESAYAACQTFVLPSLFETPGIAAMEAALAGAHISITERGGTKDYFKDHAEYLSPDSSDSVAEAINHSLQKEQTPALKNHILENYTWNIVGEMTMQKYQKLA